MGPKETAAWLALTAAIDAWHANPRDALWAVVDEAWTTYHQTNDY